MKEQSKGVAFGKITWSNISMTNSPLSKDIPESARTPLVEWLLKVIAEQQLVIEQQRDTIAKLEAKVSQLEEKVGNLDEQLLVAKKLKGIDISAGQVNRILICDKELFHTEQEDVLRVGLETAEYVHTDDPGARHQGQTGIAQ